VKENIVEIPTGSGNRYRYAYEDGKTTYLGPIGEAPPMVEAEFLLTLSEIERTPIEDRVKIVTRKRKGHPTTFEITERGYDVWSYFTDDGEKGNVIIVDRLDRRFIEDTIKVMKENRVRPYGWSRSVEEEFESTSIIYELLIDDGWVQVRTTKGTIQNPNVGTRPEVREWEESHSPFK
jgi:hypothetical protein